MNTPDIPFPAPNTVYAEQAQIEQLKMQVANSQFQVAELQADVNALEEKSATFSGFLAEAEANLSSALVNYNQATDIKNSTEALNQSTWLAYNQTTTSSTKISAVSADMANLINKLIFSVEVIDKFGKLIKNQRQSNPLIPESLTSLLEKAATDANNAIALTLTALESCYAAEATANRSNSVCEYQLCQLLQLATEVSEFNESEADKAITSIAGPYAPVTYPGTKNANSGQQQEGQTQTPTEDTLFVLVKAAYTSAKEKYTEAQDAMRIVEHQLAHAQQRLATATTSLNSWQAGLAAAQAAAYAA